ncbi:hypothetical protein [Nonomuraea sp. LPB2021202275-12-8]|uniref:hypothetical protein n=1 Tax=Nonomuraea sp. LPB2021202275-12-8 TaxID=3120159 RepID=UPI00300C1D96
MSGEQRPDRVVNLDLVEHLDDKDCLVEVNVALYSDDRYVQVMLTDLAGETTTIRLTAEQAGTVGYIIRTFDRRGTREFGDLLSEGAILLREASE